MNKITLKPKSTLKDALKVIDTGAVKLAVVTDDENRVLGTISDGDIRRAILKGINLDDSIEGIYNKNPILAYEDYSKQKLIDICTKHKIYQIPIVDKERKLIDLAILDELLKPANYPNKVVLMLGGLGTRLRPLTEEIPKPMLKVGNKPILETIVNNFKLYGFNNFVFCVNYKSHIIENYFKDGEDFGVNIEYVYEDEKMGTAGALSLIKKPEEAFFVMNGDLLTNVNFEYMLEYHKKNSSLATMAVRDYEYQIPFGVVESSQGRIVSIKEKPTFRYFVNAGIYILEPECIDYIPNEYYDMPMLFEKLIEENKKAVSFPIREYWLDIGRIDEYEKANREYEEVFE